MSLSKIRVYGKAQNRTALGIANAYLTMYPNATLKDLNTAFPASLANGDVFAKIEVAKNDTMNYFLRDDEIIKLSDGSKVSFRCMWTKDMYNAIVEHAKQYDIEIASFEQAEKGFGKKGSFELEYLNNYVPPKSKQSKKKATKILTGIAGTIVVVGTISWFTWIQKLCDTANDIIDVKDKIEDMIDTTTKNTEQTKPKMFEGKIEKGEDLILNNIEFNYNSAKLKSSSNAELNKLVEALKSNVDIRIDISGHASKDVDYKDEAEEQALSEARAKAVYNYLYKKGIDANRLTYKGYGTTKPIADNFTQEGRERNRRVEFKVR